MSAENPPAAAERLPSLFLRRPNLDDLPPPALPDGYTLRTYREGDAAELARVLQAAFPEMEWTPPKARGALIEDQTVKTVFVIEHDATGKLAATASARDLPDAHPGAGYVHWVGADPEHRGRQLGLLASLATLHEFARWGRTGAVLETDDFRIPAIKVYLKLGFAPEYRHASHAERWERLRGRLT